MDEQLSHKESSIGMLPEDWKITKLGDLVNYVKGFAFKSRDYQSNGVRIIRVSDTTFDAISDDNQVFIDISHANSYRKWKLNEFDLIISTVGSKPPMYDSIVGRVVQVDKMHEGSLLNQNAVVIRSKEKSPYQQELILNQCRTKRYQNYIEKIFRGNANQASITLNDLFEFPIAIPKKEKEQRAIAEVLGDVNALIAALDRLIAKKHVIKQGVMQQLLTGKKRLPGFMGEWAERTLLDLAGGKKELFDDGDWIESEHITSEGIRLIQTGNIGIGTFIERDNKKFVFEKSFVSLRCKEIRQGDLLICRLADPAGRSCVLPDIGEAKIITSVDVTIFRPPSSAANRVFLTNLFSTDQWFRAVSDRSGGTTHKRISRGALGRLMIRVPPVEEQNAIAGILSDMDAEIATLKTRQEKTRALKQGLMHELLTGRIRLLCES